MNQSNIFALPHYQPERSIKVLAETEELFLKNPEIRGRLENIILIYHSVEDCIPETVENLWSGHFFPYRESFSELQICFNLAVFGFYK